MEIILERINPCASLIEWIHVLPGKKIRLGRAMSSDVRLLSVCVSRVHAEVEGKADHLEVTDLNSKCGVSVNKRRIPPNIPHEVMNGDIVEIGSPGDGERSNLEKQDLFIYKLKLIDKKSFASLPPPSNVQATKEIVEKRKLHTSPTSPTQDIKRQKLDDNNNCSDQQFKKLEEKLHNIYTEKESLKEAFHTKQEEYDRKLAEKSFLLHETEDTLKEKVVAAEAELQSVKDKEVAMELEMERMKEEKTKEEQRKKEEIRRAEIKIEEEKEEILKQRENELEELLRKELDMKTKEEIMKQENDVLEKKLKMKEETLKAKDCELKSQAEQLQQIEEKCLSAESSRSALLENLECELQCLFCNAMFIVAVTANCRHSFCQMCIGTWMNVKKECPTCRAPIVTLTRSLALDNAICELVKKMSEAEQNERNEAVRERERAAAARAQDIIDLTQDGGPDRSVTEGQPVAVAPIGQTNRTLADPTGRRRQGGARTTRNGRLPWRY